MQNRRLYLVQIFGIFMLLFGYWLHDRPDRLSVMHFNLSAQHTFTAIDDDSEEHEVVNTSTTKDNHHLHKYRVGKYFSLKVQLPLTETRFQYVPFIKASYNVPLTESYHYLFCKEINPPPPKSC